MKGKLMTGRPPIPNEQKKLKGTYRPGRNPVPIAQVQQLDRAQEMPQPLSPLGDAGEAFWISIWQTGLNWISPQTDIHLVQLVAEQFDERAELREKVRTNSIARERSGLRELEKQLTGNLAALGLNPSDRARLGFALVKTESKLENFLRMKEQRRTDREMDQELGK